MKLAPHFNNLELLSKLHLSKKNHNHLQSQLIKLYQPMFNLNLLTDALASLLTCLILQRRLKLKYLKKLLDNNKI